MSDEEDTKVEEYATMAEQIEKTRLAGLNAHSSSDSSDEEEEQVDDGPDIFADDMALGEEASTLESNASKSEDSKLNSFAKKGLRKVALIGSKARFK